MTVVGSARRNVANRMRVRSYEQWHAFEYAQRYADEVTDQSERMVAPMFNEFIYQRGPGGELLYKGESTRSVLDKGLQDGQRMVAANPSLQFELDRRLIEYDENAMAERLAPGEGFAVMSTFPDELVTDPSLPISGYNRERQKMLVRIWWGDTDGVHVAHMSLDQSNYQGMQAIARKLGHDLPDGLRSKDVLAQRLPIFPWMIQDMRSLGDDIRQAYDTSLHQQMGGEWYAGMPKSELDTFNALSFIEQQTDLLNQHMAIVMPIAEQTFDTVERNRLLAKHRYNLAAALHARLRGVAVQDMAAAGEAAREAGMKFDGDCPTAEAQLAAIGMSRGGTSGETVWVNCPHCLARVRIDPCADVIGCSGCSALVVGGRVVSKGRVHAAREAEKQSAQAAAQSAEKSSPETTPKANTYKPETLVNLGGMVLLVKKTITFGSVETRLVNSHTGAVAYTVNEGSGKLRAAAKPRDASSPYVLAA